MENYLEVSNLEALLIQLLVCSLDVYISEEHIDFIKPAKTLYSHLQANFLRI